MKNRKITLKTIIIILLICINISFLLIILNIKNKNIEQEKIIKEQLGETTGDSSYISLSTHMSELDEKQKEINNMQNIAGQATATTDKILKNYTAYKDGKLITGTMANNGAVTKTLNAGASYTIPAGYHNGSGKVTANSLGSQTSATATSNDILFGKTAWVNGTLITGNATDSSKHKVTYQYTGNNGTTTYTTTRTDLDKNKTYYAVMRTLTGYTSPPNVSSISKDGIYELFHETTSIFAGAIGSKMRVFKITNATSVTFTTVLTATNQGVDTYWFEI